MGGGPKLKSMGKSNISKVVYSRSLFIRVALVLIGARKVTFSQGWVGFWVLLAARRLWGSIVLPIPMGSSLRTPHPSQGPAQS